MKNIYTLEHIYDNSTRGSLIRYRLAFSVLKISRVMAIPLVFGLCWRTFWILREDVIDYDYYYRPSLNFGWLCVVIAGIIMIGFGISSISTITKLMADSRIREILNPCFNIWHDSACVVARIGGFVFSLGIYLLLIVVQIFGIVGLNCCIGNLRFIWDYVWDHSRTYYDLERFDFLTQSGCVACLICVVIMYVCLSRFTPNHLQQEEANS